MAAESKLRIVIESTGLEAVTSGFGKMDKTAKEATRTINEFEREAKKAANEAAREAKKAASEASKEVDKINTKLKGIGDTALNMLNPLNLLKNGLAAIFAGVTVAAIVKTADEMQNLEARLKQVSKSAEEYQGTFAALSKTSTQTGQSIKDTGRVFLNFQMGLAGLGKSNADVARLTDVVSKLGVVSGASGAAINESLRQLSQGLASGVLQGDELRSIRENLPPLAQAIADGMGVAVGSLKKLGSEGKITGEVIYDALAKQAEKIEERFNAMPLTVGRAVGMVANSFQLFVGAFDKVTGISGALAQAIKAISDGLLYLTQNIDAAVKGAVEITAGLTGFLGTIALVAAAMTATFNPALVGLVATVGVAAAAIGVLASQIAGHLTEAYQIWYRNNGVLAKNNVSMVTVIAAAFQKLPRIAEAVGYSIADAFQNGMMAAANAVAQFVNYAGNQLIKLAKKIPKPAQAFLGMNLDGAKFDAVPFKPSAFKNRGGVAFSNVNKEIVNLAVGMTKNAPYNLFDSKGSPTNEAGGKKGKKGPKASDATSSVFESARNLYNDTALSLQKNEDKLKAIVDYTKQLGTLGLEGAKRWKAEQDILNEYNQKAKELSQKRIDLERKLQQAMGKNATTKGGVKGSANIAATRSMLDKIRQQEEAYRRQGTQMVEATRLQGQTEFLQKLKEEANEKATLLNIDKQAVDILKAQGEAAANLFVEREKVRISIEKAAAALGLSAGDPKVKQAVQAAQQGITDSSAQKGQLFTANFERETQFQKDMLALKEQAKQKEKELGQYEAERWLAIQQRVMEYKKQFESMGLNPDQFQGKIEERARVDVENNLTTVGNKLTAMQQLFQGLKSTIGQTFLDMVTGATNAKTAMVGLLRAIAVELIKVFALQALTGFIKGGNKGSAFLGKVFGIGTTAPVGNALGGVYSNGVKKFAKGGVVENTTLFGTRGGLGMMGEAGPEAIMPLMRGPNGSLGVQAFGGGMGGGSVVINAPITINMQSSGQGDNSTGQQAAMIGKAVQDSIRVTIQEELMNQMRPGGILNSTPF